MTIKKKNKNANPNINKVWIFLWCITGDAPLTHSHKESWDDSVFFQSPEYQNLQNRNVSVFRKVQIGKASLQTLSVVYIIWQFDTGCKTISQEHQHTCRLLAVKDLEWQNGPRVSICVVCDKMVLSPCWAVDEVLLVSIWTWDLHPL